MNAWFDYWWKKVQCFVWGHITVVEWDENYLTGYVVCERCRKIMRKLDIRGHLPPKDR